MATNQGVVGSIPASRTISFKEMAQKRFWAIFFTILPFPPSHLAFVPFRPPRAPTHAVTGTPIRTGATDVWSVRGNALVAGSYYVRVNGNIASDDGASFGGAVMLMPVPEPDAYGMMLGGLGILGFLARGRMAKRS